MIILTDSISFAQNCVPYKGAWQEHGVSALGSAERILASKLFEAESVMVTEVPGEGHWDCLFAVDHASCSQYDMLAELAASGQVLSGRILCSAGGGERFHGFKGRSWHAHRGNIHLSAYVEPGQEIAGGAAGFIVAGVLAAVQAADDLDLRSERPGIKWVNDVLVNGAKVGGVLARLQTQRGIVKSAVVGIGLNVERRPAVARDPHVPAVAALADFAADPANCSHAVVFPRLVTRLGENIGRLYRGEYEQLLDLYRERSLVVGRDVTIREDRGQVAGDVIARGRVNSIGPELELYIEGHTRPVTKGRLILG